MLLLPALGRKTANSALWAGQWGLDIVGMPHVCPDSMLFIITISHFSPFPSITPIHLAHVSVDIKMLGTVVFPCMPHVI